VNADDLRAVAADIREKANAYKADPIPSRVDIDREGTCDECAEIKHLVASYPDGDSEPWLCADCVPFIDHTAAWTPAVALAVADWLDVEANVDAAGFHDISPAALLFVAAWRGES